LNWLCWKTEEGNRFVAQNYNSQIELRDKQLEMNKQQTQNYQKLAEEASNRQIPEKKMQEPYVSSTTIITIITTISCK
jgi:hypothetical protein